jgi:hypothetical protein
VYYCEAKRRLADFVLAAASTGQGAGFSVLYQDFSLSFTAVKLSEKSR